MAVALLLQLAALGVAAARKAGRLPKLVPRGVLATARGRIGAYARAAAALGGDARRRARRFGPRLQPTAPIAFAGGRAPAEERPAAAVAPVRAEPAAPTGARPARTPKEARRDAETEARLLRQKSAADLGTEPLKAKVRRSQASSKKPQPERAADEALLREKLAASAASAKPWRTPQEPKPALHAVAAVAAPEVARLAPRPAAREECEIHWWRGYVTSQFAAMVESPDGTVTVAVSPFFNWRKRESPAETPAAARALRALVESLERDGWAVSGHGDDWFSVRLRATATTRKRNTEVEA